MAPCLGSVRNQVVRTVMWVGGGVLDVNDAPTAAIKTRRHHRRARSLAARAGCVLCHTPCSRLLVAVLYSRAVRVLVHACCVGRLRLAHPTLPTTDRAVVCVPPVGFRSGAKRRAPRAVAEIKKFAQKVMGTSDVRVDTGLNKFVWSKGIRNVPFRVRVRLARKVAEDEEASEKVCARVGVAPSSVASLRVVCWRRWHGMATYTRAVLGSPPCFSAVHSLHLRAQEVLQGPREHHRRGRGG